MFTVGKAAAIASALMSTYQGAAQAMKDVPYPFNIAAAASVIAAGMVQVQNIRSTSFGGGGGGGAPSSGTPATNAGGGPFSQGGIQGTSRQSQAVNVTIVGDSFGPDHIRKLMTGMNDVLGDGFKLNVAGAA
jgi:hypothetical protein